jgi:hypothetical protein
MPLSFSLSCAHEYRDDTGLPANGSHSGSAALTFGCSSSPLVATTALGRAALSLSFLQYIVGTQGETLTIFDLCNVMLVVMDFIF